MTGGPPLPAVVLAAGAASRFGSAKQAAALHGTPLVRRAASAAHAAGSSPVIVVVGAHADAVREALAEVPYVSIVYNARWESGLASSVAAGIRAARAASPECDGVLLTAADQPAVDAASLRTILAAFPGRAGAAAALYDGVLGVPAVIGAEHLDAVAGGEGDRGAGAWLRANRARVVAVPCAAAAHDVDTVTDLTRVSAIVEASVERD